MERGRVVIRGGSMGRITSLILIGSLSHIYLQAMEDGSLVAAQGLAEALAIPEGSGVGFLQEVVVHIPGTHAVDLAGGPQQGLHSIEDQETQCPLCFESLEGDQKNKPITIVLPCKHEFHLDCSRQLRKNHQWFNRCIKCRQTFETTQPQPPPRSRIRVFCEDDDRAPILVKGCCAICINLPFLFMVAGIILRAAV